MTSTTVRTSKRTITSKNTTGITEKLKSKRQEVELAMQCNDISGDIYRWPSPVTIVMNEQRKKEADDGEQNEEVRRPIINAINHILFFFRKR